jgi:hypothetical protein
MASGLENAAMASVALTTPATHGRSDGLLGNAAGNNMTGEEAQGYRFLFTRIIRMAWHGI